MSFFHIYSQVYMNQRDYGISLKAVAYSKNIPIPAWELRGKNSMMQLYFKHQESGLPNIIFIKVNTSLHL